MSADQVVQACGSHVIYGLLYKKTHQLRETREEMRRLLCELIPLQKIGGIRIQNSEGVQFNVTFLPCYADHDLCEQIMILNKNFKDNEVLDIKNAIGLMIQGIRTYFAALMHENQDFYERLTTKPMLSIEPNNLTFFFDPAEEIRFGIYVQKSEDIEDNSIDYADENVIRTEIAKMLDLTKKYI